MTAASGEAFFISAGHARQSSQTGGEASATEGEEVTSSRAAEAACTGRGEASFTGKYDALESRVSISPASPHPYSNLQDPVLSQSVPSL